MDLSKSTKNGERHRVSFRDQIETEAVMRRWKRDCLFSIYTDLQNIITFDRIDEIKKESCSRNGRE